SRWYASAGEVARVLNCEKADLVPWTPDFSSSGQRSPRWTKLVCEGVELCNSIEWAEWGENPVQVQICDECGTPMCASGGYVHVSRLGNDLLWTPPTLQDLDERDAAAHAASYAVRKKGALLIPGASWAEWRRRFSSLPSFDTFPETRRIDLAQAWISETRGAT